MQQEEPAVVSTASSKDSLAGKLKRNLWMIVCLVLLVALIVSIVLWKPWQATVKAGERTVSVTGNATIKAEPDEFVFYPSYEFTSSDKQTALTNLTAKSSDMVSKLKSLGVPSNKIKTDTSGYSNVYSATPDGTSTYSFSLTVTTTKDLVQKVQDYLVTTGPSGSVSPQATFSDSLQKKLEGQARDQAEKDARNLADQSAKNLGFKVDKVKSVEDNGFDNFGFCPGGLCAGANLDAATSSSSQLTVQPGENELPYSVKVTYYIH